MGWRLKPALAMPTLPGRGLRSDPHFRLACVGSVAWRSGHGASWGRRRPGGWQSSRNKHQARTHCRHLPGSSEKWHAGGSQLAERPLRRGDKGQRCLGLIMASRTGAPATALAWGQQACGPRLSAGSWPFNPGD